MSITIKDIAQVAGVSYSTVSKALNDSPLVKPETKSKIIGIAQELGYEPNYAAQQLVRKQSRVIGLIWPTIERIAPATLLTRINEEISKNAYSMVLSINSIKESLEMFKRFNVDGIIVFDERNQEEFESISFPVVTYGVAKKKAIPVVDVNYQQAMEKAVKYLYELGHREIAYVGDFSLGDERQKEKYYGFKNAMTRLRLPVSRENLINTNGLDWYDGYLATKRLISSSISPTAVIGGSYDISAGVVRALREANRVIPKDVSVISYDNVPQMANLEVPLTSVGVPVEDMAFHIVKTLMAHMHKDDTVPYVNILTPEITERNSCAHAQNIHRKLQS